MFKTHIARRKGDLDEVCINMKKKVSLKTAKLICLNKKFSETVKTGRFMPTKGQDNSYCPCPRLVRELLKTGKSTEARFHMEPPG